MARLIMVFQASLLLLTSPSATARADLYYRTVMADNPVAYWRLNETSGTAFFDSAGILDGTLSGAMTLNQPGAVIGREPDAAIIFEGGYGYAPYAAVLANPTFSIECWARVVRSSAGTALEADTRGVAVHRGPYPGNGRIRGGWGRHDPGTAPSTAAGGQYEGEKQHAPAETFHRRDSISSSKPQNQPRTGTHSL